MNDEAEARAAGAELPSGAAPPPVGATPGVPGWFPDPWSTSLRRWWTGGSWTFATSDLTAGVTPPPPPPMPAAPPPPPPPPPAPVRPPAPPAPPAGPKKEAWTARVGRLVGNHKILVAVVLGLIVGLLGVQLFHTPDRPSTSTGNSAIGPSRNGTLAPSPTTPAPSATSDPSSSALSSLIVKPPDVPASATVTLLPGGGGLSQATLDICNGTFPSEAKRTARLQDVVLDDQGQQALSTEAVLYGDPAAAAQAFSELKSVAAACPSTPVPSPVGEPTVITKFNPAPDGSWPQTPTVNRLAFDFVSTDSTGQPFHSVAVYLQRGRALMGVYFSQPDGAQLSVTGQTTIPGIVGVFAARVAALPTSVVGS